MIVETMSTAQICKEIDRACERTMNWFFNNFPRLQKEISHTKTGFKVYRLPEKSQNPNLIFITQSDKKSFAHQILIWRESPQGKHFYSCMVMRHGWHYQEFTPHFVARYIERLGLDCTPMEAMIHLMKNQMVDAGRVYETVNAATKKQNELLRECQPGTRQGYFKTSEGIAVIEIINNYYLYRTFLSNEMGFEVEKPVFEELEAMHEDDNFGHDVLYSLAPEGNTSPMREFESMFIPTGYQEHFNEDLEEYFGQKRPVVEVVCGIIENEGEVLCVQRPYGGMASTSGRWEFPGGKIEEGETPEDALKRELFEELDMEGVKVKGHVLTLKHAYAELNLKLHAYLCEVDNRYLSRNEHIDHKWLKPADFGKLRWAAADKRLIQSLNIAYKETHIFQPEELEHLFLTVGWASADYPDKLVEAMKGYKTVFSAWDGDKLVGLIAAMDDGVMTAYIHYLLVDPEYQGLGVGKRLAHKLKERYKDYLRITLNATEEAVKFYTSLGFKVDEGERAMHLTTMRN